MPRIASFGALVCLIVTLSLTARERPKVAPAAVEDGITVRFSPDGGCTDAIVEAIGRAERAIDVQAYNFTSPDIHRALAVAHQRGVKVRALLDKSNDTDRYSGATFLANHGIPVYIDAKHSIAHSKVIVIDGQTVISGSFNFTRSAEERNAENLLVIECKPKIVAAYLANIESHLRHCEPYRGKGGDTPTR